LSTSGVDIDLLNSSGSVITSTDNFKTWWKTVATEFASNDKVIFDTSKPLSRIPMKYRVN
jgi:hypothetical protein